MNRYLSLFILLITTLSGAELYAQSCQQKLGEATQAYYNGQLRDVEPMLTNCLNELDKADKSAALKLLINASLILNEDEKADNYMFEFLSNDPFYKQRDDDLAEFKSLYSSYQLRTRYTIGLSIGTVFPDYIIMRHQSYSGQTEEPNDYDEIPGISVGVTGDVGIWKGLFFNASVLYSQRSFKQKETIMNYQTVSTYERDKYLDVPLQLRYVFDLGTVNPYVGGGYALHYLIKAEGDLDHVPTEPDFPKVIGVPVLVDGYNLTDIRRRFTHNWILSAGVAVKVDKYLVEIRGSYEIGLNNLISVEDRGSNRELVETYAYIPDDVRVNSLVFSVVLSKNFLRPLKMVP